MFGHSYLMLEKNNIALITWRCCMTFINGEVIFRAQISSRSMSVLKVHNLKLFFNSARCAAEQLCPQSSGGWRPKRQSPMDGGCGRSLTDDCWDNEWRRLLLPFQNQAKFKRNNLLRNPDSGRLYLMNNQYPAELIKTAFISARKTDVAWHYSLYLKGLKGFAQISNSIYAIKNNIELLGQKYHSLGDKSQTERNSFQILFPILSETVALFEIPSFTIRWYYLRSPCLL